MALAVNPTNGSCSEEIQESPLVMRWRGGWLLVSGL